MKQNFNYSIGIIAALSLLLGLSLGQLHDQYRTIEQMDVKSSHIRVLQFRPADFHRGNHHRPACNEAHRRAEEIRSQIEAEKALIEQEQARLRLELKKSNEEIMRDKTHVILREEL